MKTFRLLVVLGGAALLGLLGVASASASTLGEGVVVDRSATTGRVNLIGTDPGVAIAPPAGLPDSAGPRRTALAFADAYGAKFGVRGGAGDLSVASVTPGVAGGRTVRLQQQVGGIPVIGGELQVNLDDRLELRSITGEGEAGKPASSEPKVSAGEAADSAIASVARAEGVDPGDLEASEPALAILDSRILGGPGQERPLLVWQLEVTNRGAVQTIKEMVAVDAELGNVAVSISGIHEALNRVVCDAGSTDSRVPCAAPFVRTEGSGPTGDSDNDLAYEYAGDTYSLYQSLGRDSIDDAGLQLKSTTHYCKTGTCPNYANAFWNGQQMVYGNGFPSADDVVGHELTHGVTEFTSNLFYYYQSGAINESLSDVFGEFVDLTNGSGNDTPGVRWLLGEDVPGFGAIRDMANPPAFGDPDRTGSPNYAFNTDTDFDIGDAGGVHTNSGVNNKAAFLMTDGGSFNGQTVSGLGIEKVKRIYYRVDSALLGSASDYQNLAAALRQACSDLATNGTGGITTADCAQVNKAVVATQMDTPPAKAPALDLPACDAAGTSPVNAYFQNFENSSAVLGQWAPFSVIGSIQWFYPAETGIGSYATSGTQNLWGYDQAAVSDTGAQMTTDVKVPAGGKLRFQHAYGFETSGGGAWDGGVLEYSTNGGASWQDAKALIEPINGYTGTIENSAGNPLSGRPAFVGESKGYITTRANLSSLAGQNVRFRFRMGTDALVEDYGWFIDDVQIYACKNKVPPSTTIKKAPKKVKSKKSKAKARFKFTGSDDLTPASQLGFQCKLDGGKFQKCGATQKFKVKAKPGKGKKHKLQVRAVDSSGNVDPTPAKATFKAIKKGKRKRR